jgi:hypothetical protein
MKKIIHLVLLLTSFLFPSCAKQAITSDKEYYIGEWKQAKKDPEAVYELEINADGTGKYASVKPGSTVNVAGNVYFKGRSEFTIGGKIIKKKFKVNRAPVRIVESLKPYKFHYEATFNDIEFKR